MTAAGARRAVTFPTRWNARLPLRLAPLWLLGALVLWAAVGRAQAPSTAADSPKADSKGGATQPPAAAEGDPVDAGAGALVREEPTRIFYVRDAEGRLVPLLNHSLEKIQELLAKGGPKAAQQPSYTLQNLQVDGAALANHAALTFRFEVQVSSDDWIRVPLRLPEAILQSAEFKGPGEHLLEFADDGHVCWIHAGKSAAHQVTLKALVRLSESAAERRLRLTAPRVTQSKLTLKAPMAPVAARVSERALLESVKSTGAESELIATGLDSGFEIAWRRPDAMPGPSPASLEATASILVTVQSRSVRSQATLMLTSPQGQIDVVRVKLPEGAKVVPDSVQTLDGEPLDFEVLSGAGTVEIQVDPARAAAGTLGIRLTTERTPDEDKPEVDLAGFEVASARQSGHVAVKVVGDWQLVFRRQGIWQVDIDDLPDRLRQDGVEFGFEFFSPRWTLAARIERRQPRVLVEPRYFFDVYPDRVELEARLRYTIRRAAVRSLEVDPNGWEFDLAQVTSDQANLVDLDSIVDQQNKVEIPLSRRQLGQFEIVLRGVRRLPPGATSIDLVLPRPRYDSLGPAAVWVQPADHVELSPRTSELVGLSRHQSSPGDQPTRPRRQQKPLVYRTAVATARFVGDIVIHAREITAEIASQVDLTQTGGQVRQRIVFNVNYEPVSELVLLAPRALEKFEKLDVRLGQSPASLLPVPGHPANSPTAVAMRLPLTGDQIGTLEVQLKYALPELPATATSRDIPLLMPADALLLDNRLWVQAAAGMKVEARGNRWTVDADAAEWDRTRAGSLRLSAVGPELTAPLSTEREAHAVRQTTEVTKAWIQSRLQGHARRDRVCLELRSAASRLSVQLPPGRDPASLDVLIDGVEPAPDRVNVSHSGLATLDLGVVSDRPLRIELEYDVALGEGDSPTSETGPFGARRMTLAGLTWPADVRVNRTYWEVILPGDQHLLWAPGDFASEMTWGWHGFYWGRQPTLDAQRLGTWIGVLPGLPAPPGTNSYLFSRLGDSPQLTLQTASRPGIVLAASGTALVLGLMFLYLPLMRSAGMLLALGVAVAGLGLMFPEPALLVAQGATLGVVLAALAGWMRGSHERRLGRGVVVRGAAPAGERRSTDLFRPPSSPTAENSTASASIAAEAAAPK